MGPTVELGFDKLPLEYFAILPYIWSRCQRPLPRQVLLTENTSQRCG